MFFKIKLANEDDIFYPYFRLLPVDSNFSFELPLKDDDVDYKIVNLVIKKSTKERKLESRILKFSMIFCGISEISD